jgi:ribosomal protein S27E
VRPLFVYQHCHNTRSSFISIQCCDARAHPLLFYQQRHNTSSSFISIACCDTPRPRRDLVYENAGLLLYN